MSSSSTNLQDLQAIAARAMIERGLVPAFTAEAMAEVEGLAALPRESGPSIRDLRSLLWCSIDNEDSRDLDQLSVSMPADDGVRILVAIADVDALVKKGSAIDEQARNNTATVYTAARIFPMIPERLSTDLTSLNPDVERLTVVTDMLVDAEGRVKSADLYRALVLNHARLTYDDVAAWLDGVGPAPGPVARDPALAEQLRIQDRCAQGMRELRQEQGALSLGAVESKVVFSGEGVAGIRTEEKNRAKEMIENFMIAVNGATARYLDAKKFSSIRRVLRVPKRWDRIVSIAGEQGVKLPAEPDPRALEVFLRDRRAKDPDHFAELSLAVVKLLGSGEYAVELPGRPAGLHFGLAVKDYAHSTAPNRRYPDLVTQRLLKAAFEGDSSPYDDDELARLAQHCTRQEDNAAKVERQVRKSASALYLASRVGERFDAIVTGASAKGTYVRIFHPTAEGRVVRGHQGLDVGEHVVVQLLKTDVAKGFIDFARAT
jgi:VacB/RNase II family 3'-5' exoribonuclease